MCDTHTHLESVFAVWQLEEESVRAVPVAVDNVNLPVAIKICQSHAPSMLRSVLYSCVSERKGIIITVCVCVCVCVCVGELHRDVCALYIGDYKLSKRRAFYAV